MKREVVGMNKKKALNWKREVSFWNEQRRFVDSMWAQLIASPADRPTDTDRNGLYAEWKAYCASKLCRVWWRPLPTLTWSDRSVHARVNPPPPHELGTVKPTRTASQRGDQLLETSAPFRLSSSTYWTVSLFFFFLCWGLELFLLCRFQINKHLEHCRQRPRESLESWKVRLSKKKLVGPEGFCYLSFFWNVWWLMILYWFDT